MILVTGARGQVGRAWLRQLGPGRAIGIDHRELDLSLQPDVIEARLERELAHVPLTAVVHPAAYTAVDQAEREPELAFAINAQASGAIARFAARRKLPLVSYSTDYVYSGEGARPWVETDPVRPLSRYGQTKLEGERAIELAGGMRLIFRTSWIYDESGKNFLNTMLKLGAERETLRVVADQHGAPTYAPHLVAASWAALSKAMTEGPGRFPSGIYHLCNDGETTWHGFAEAIFAQALALGIPLKVKQVEAIRTADYPTPAHRPANSRLDTSLAERTFGVRLPDWHRGLIECMQRKFAR